MDALLRLISRFRGRILADAEPRVLSGIGGMQPSFQANTVVRQDEL